MCGICGAVSIDGVLDPRIAQPVTRMSGAGAPRPRWHEANADVVTTSVGFADAAHNELAPRA